METGVAKFGEKAQYGVLTKQDSSRLLRLALLGGIANPSEGHGARQLIRRCLGFISPIDRTMLAGIAADAACEPWIGFAEELKKGIE